MFDTFVVPASTWRPPTALPVPQPNAQTQAIPHRRHWTDAANDGDWEEAVLGLLRERHDAVPYWRVVNTVVLEHCPSTREQVRRATRQALQAVKALTRDRRILRYRRGFLVALDLVAGVVPHPAEDANLRSDRGR